MIKIFAHLLDREGEKNRRSRGREKGECGWGKWDVGKRREGFGEERKWEWKGLARAKVSQKFTDSPFFVTFDLFLLITTIVQNNESYFDFMFCRILLLLLL